VAAFVRNRPGAPPVLVSECVLEDRGGRLFLVGSSLPIQKGGVEWTDGVRRAIAWDAVDEYLLFDSPEDYYLRAPSAPAAAAPLPMPMFASPESSEGHPVEPSGVHFQPESPLEVGARVLAFSQDRWWRADVIAVQDEQVTIRFPGWGAEWNSTVSKTSLQVDLSESLMADDSFKID
jgi:hypothetical protein